MLCRNCGGQIPDNSKFCVNCGIKIEDEISGYVR
ncbi:MAG: zinc-ribbon domain-containing protein [Acutalibacteraceae bacterium]